MSKRNKTKKIVLVGFPYLAFSKQRAARHVLLDSQIFCICLRNFEALFISCYYRSKINVGDIRYIITYNEKYDDKAIMKSIMIRHMIPIILKLRLSRSAASRSCSAKKTSLITRIPYILRQHT